MTCVEGSKLNCSRQTEAREHALLARLPQYPFDATEFFLQQSNVTNEQSFYDFVMNRSGIVTVVGSTGRGKTRFMAGLLQTAIRYRWAAVPDELRFLYNDAEEAFEEIATQRFNDESNFDAVIRNTGLLALDNVDSLSTKHRALAASVVCARSDKGRVTVLGAKSITDMQAMDERFGRRIMEGQTVYLRA